MKGIKVLYGFQIVFNMKSISKIKTCLTNQIFTLHYSELKISFLNIETQFLKKHGRFSNMDICHRKILNRYNSILLDF